MAAPLVPNTPSSDDTNPLASQSLPARRAAEQVKCIVTDADQVLWTGILAEDGPAGCLLTEDNLEYQRALLALKERGVLLVLVSKNDRGSIEEMFARRRADMPLSKDDFAVLAADWRPKGLMVKEALERITVLPGNAVVVDDSDLERAEILAVLPEVRTNPDLQFLRFLRDLRSGGLIDIQTPTAEDTQRTELVKASQRRAAGLQQAEGVIDFLYACGVQVAIAENPGGRAVLERMSQLTARTHRFNLTGKQYSAEELAELSASGAARVFALSTKDSYGDDLLSGLLIFARKNGGPVWSVEGFYMSCRVLGRMIDRAFFSACLDRLQLLGAETLKASLHRTTANKALSDYYDSWAMNRVNGASWTGDIAMMPRYYPGWIRLERCGWRLQRTISVDVRALTGIIEYAQIALGEKRLDDFTYWLNCCCRIDPQLEPFLYDAKLNHSCDEAGRFQPWLGRAALALLAYFEELKFPTAAEVARRVEGLSGQQLFTCRVQKESDGRLGADSLPPARLGRIVKDYLELLQSHCRVDFEDFHLDLAGVIMDTPFMLDGVRKRVVIPLPAERADGKRARQYAARLASGEPLVEADWRDHPLTQRLAGRRVDAVMASAVEFVRKTTCEDAITPRDNRPVTVLRQDLRVVREVFGGFLDETSSGDVIVALEQYHAIEPRYFETFNFCIEYFLAVLAKNGRRLSRHGGEFHDLDTTLFINHPMPRWRLNPETVKWVERFLAIPDDEVLISCVLHAPDILKNCEDDAKWRTFVESGRSFQVDYSASDSSEDDEF